MAGSNVIVSDRRVSAGCAPEDEHAIEYQSAVVDTSSLNVISTFAPSATSSRRCWQAFETTRRGVGVQTAPSREALRGRATR